MYNHNYEKLILSKDFSLFDENYQKLIKIASKNLDKLNCKFDTDTKIILDEKSFLEPSFPEDIKDTENSEYFAEIIANIIRFEFKEDYTEEMFLKDHKNNIIDEFNILKNKIENHNLLSFENKEKYLKPRINRFIKTYKNSYCPLDTSISKTIEEDFKSISEFYVKELIEIQNIFKFNN